MNKIEYKLVHNGMLIVGSHKVIINDKIRDEQLHEFYIVETDVMIDDLIHWASESIRFKRGRYDAVAMKEDLKMLMNLEDDYIFCSNETNKYVSESDSEFENICKELIELNQNLIE
jgi:hypothetical protein